MLLLRSEAPTFSLPGIRFTTLSSPTRGSRENAVWEVTVEPGVAGSPHRLTREETFVALEGCAFAEVDGQHHELAAGSALVVAAGQTLALSNTGTLPFRALAVFPVGGQAVIEDRPAFTPPWAA
ncbi:cupin domain-containing protein [Piscinibacter gummiphilus]|uniref:Cupin domain-containing protein n=1 Tax=Piscinibacter gummiphilus TaxID=946333 RepID=A0ABZ0CM95_9BURK|nr:cupin domain-containing protein [Piscinibacter gummiphilus]WOB06109.1 cupin domain-containing protein [Piscinibacter gummiphilus]